MPGSAGQCTRGHAARWLFRFAAGERTTQHCLLHALGYRPLVRTSVLTMLVVGTGLVAINQGNVLAAGRFPAELTWKIPLTYAVPYCVATFGALRISLLRG